jgi:hypothetical protein
MTKNWGKNLIFSIFVGHFCPYRSGLNPDPKHWDVQKRYFRGLATFILEKKKDVVNKFIFVCVKVPGVRGC